MVSKCKCCKYYGGYTYFKNKKVHTCERFKDKYGLVFSTATEAYKLGCKGKYKKLVELK